METLNVSILRAALFHPSAPGFYIHGGKKVVIKREQSRARSCFVERERARALVQGRD